jgi:AcrR family transcriptional regulator
MSPNAVSIRRCHSTSSRASCGRTRRRPSWQGRTPGRTRRIAHLRRIGPGRFAAGRRVPPGATGSRLSTDARREQLVALGIEIFSERPFDEVSIDDIAAAAGISKGLLYHYFPSKRDFYVAVIRSAADEMQVMTEPDPALEPRERLAGRGAAGGATDRRGRLGRLRRGREPRLARAPRPRPRRPARDADRPPRAAR